jgi:hypothetical protein
LFGKWVGAHRDCAWITGKPEVENEGPGGATMIWPGKQERRQRQLGFFQNTLTDSCLSCGGHSPVSGYIQNYGVARHFRTSVRKSILAARNRHPTGHDFVENLWSRDVEDSLPAPTTV